MAEPAGVYDAAATNENAPVLDVCSICNGPIVAGEEFRYTPSRVKPLAYHLRLCRPNEPAKIDPLGQTCENCKKPILTDQKWEGYGYRQRDNPRPVWHYFHRPDCSPREFADDRWGA